MSDERSSLTNRVALDLLGCQHIGIAGEPWPDDHLGLSRLLAPGSTGEKPVERVPHQVGRPEAKKFGTRVDQDGSAGGPRSGSDAVENLWPVVRHEGGFVDLVDKVIRHAALPFVEMYFDQWIAKPSDEKQSRYLNCGDERSNQAGRDAGGSGSCQSLARRCCRVREAPTSSCCTTVQV